MTAISQVLHEVEPGTRVELFTLDATNLGAGVHRWTTTPTALDLVWQTDTYPYAVVNVTGFELSGTGSLPRPRVEVSNLNSIFTSLVREYGDLIGATVTRVRTFAQFLDNGSDPDPTAYLQPDEYVVDQKVEQTDDTITWELSAALDAAGMDLPRRQVLRDTCLKRYRKWTTGTTFNYTYATCPYVGTDYFTRDGTVTTAQYDDCGRKTTDCKARFGATARLPTGAFPGVARVR